MLSVGPMRPLLTAASLGGARRDDDCRLQVDSLSDEWSVESWAAENRCNRLRCLLARMSGLQCFNMGHNGHGINLYGVSMTIMGN